METLRGEIKAGLESGPGIPADRAFAEQRLSGDRNARSCRRDRLRSTRHPCAHAEAASGSRARQRPPSAHRSPAQTKLRTTQGRAGCAEVRTSSQGGPRTGEGGARFLGFVDTNHFLLPTPSPFRLLSHQDELLTSQRAPPRLRAVAKERSAAGEGREGLPLHRLGRSLRRETAGPKPGL